MEDVIVIYEDCHGFIGVAKDMKSAFYFLIEHNWVYENMEFQESDEGEIFRLCELMEMYEMTMLETLLFMWDTDEGWFNEKFCFYNETLYDWRYENKRIG